MSNLKQEWFGNVRKDILAGMVVAIALIPEAIAFSIIAGVDPMMGLYASFCIAVTIAIVGGRPGMISASTGAMALVFASLVRSHGVEYMLAATVLTGVIQMIMGFLKIGKLLRFIPNPVMIGFVNALAIMVFRAQLPYFKGAGIAMYILVALGIAIIYLFPRINRGIPAPLIAILVLTVASVLGGINVTTIGDVGNITGILPSFLLPKVPISIETLKVIFPYAISLAIVGIVESLLTASLLDDKTDTKSNKNRESFGQGVANIVAGCFGGMAGCAVIGQSVMNYKSGGRGRLSTLTSGVFLMVLIVVLNKWVVMVPIAALVAVMIVVCISTFDWESLRKSTKVPKTDVAVMVTTVAVVLFTDNLAIGVVVGMLLSALFFVSKISKVRVEKTGGQDVITYTCFGQLFFASTTTFQDKFDFNLIEKNVVIDVKYLRFWDESAGYALDKVIMKYRDRGIQVKVEGVSKSCEKLLERTSSLYYLNEF